MRQGHRERPGGVGEWLGLGRQEMGSTREAAQQGLADAWRVFSRDGCSRDSHERRHPLACTRRASGLAHLLDAPGCLGDSQRRGHSCGAPRSASVRRVSGPFTLPPSLTLPHGVGAPMGRGLARATRGLMVRPSS